MPPKRPLGNTGLMVPPIALGGAAFGYRNLAAGWDPTSAAGAAQVEATVHAAIDQGISYIDTAALYGDGASETLIGRVMKTRRADCTLATKVWHELSAAEVTASVEASLRRLNTDHVDVLQVHGVAYSEAETRHIRGPVLEALLALQARGLIGHIGITAEESWTLIPFLQEPAFEVYQIAYNLIQQAAGRFFLTEAAKTGVGVVTMRTMTSGIFQYQMERLAPEWQAARDLYEVSLRFVLSDSRVHAGIIGARWPEEIARNLELLRDWRPSLDLAAAPRTTAAVYRENDRATGN